MTRARPATAESLPVTRRSGWERPTCISESLLPVSLAVAGVLPDGRGGNGSCLQPWLACRVCHLGSAFLVPFFPSCRVLPCVAACGVARCAASTACAPAALFRVCVSGLFSH